MTARTHITVIDLRGACGRDIDLFDSMFPGGAEINAHNIDLYIAAGFKVWWLTRLIPIAARSEHEKADDAAHAEEQKAIDAAREEFENAEVAACVECAKAATQALVAALTYDDVENAA